MQWTQVSNIPFFLMCWTSHSQAKILTEGCGQSSELCRKVELWAQSKEDPCGMRRDDSGGLRIQPEGARGWKFILADEPLVGKGGLMGSDIVSKGLEWSLECVRDPGAKSGQWTEKQGPAREKFWRPRETSGLSVNMEPELPAETAPCSQQEEGGETAFVEMHTW